MIGVFDSGHGGLTVFRALVERFPHVDFLYFGDHRHAPYGNRPSDEVVDLTRDAVELLFSRGCKLVLLACNTATCVAARTLQQDWLPRSRWAGHNILGIVAPTVEAATQTPWAVDTPQYPQKFNTDVIAVFGTMRTITSFVYPEEIRKRCPRATVVQQVCPGLVAAIEAGQTDAELEIHIINAVAGMMAQTGGAPPHRAILGCTHFPLVEPLFRKHLPAVTRLLPQPEIVADSLDDYLTRRPHYLGGAARTAPPHLLTSGDAARVTQTGRLFWHAAPPFQAVSSRLGASPDG